MYYYISVWKSTRLYCDDNDFLVEACCWRILIQRNFPGGRHCGWLFPLWPSMLLLLTKTFFTVDPKKRRRRKGMLAVSPSFQRRVMEISKESRNRIRTCCRIKYKTVITSTSWVWPATLCEMGPIQPWSYDRIFLQASSSRTQNPTTPVKEHSSSTPSSKLIFLCLMLAMLHLDACNADFYPRCFTYCLIALLFKELIGRTNIYWVWLCARHCAKGVLNSLDTVCGWHDWPISNREETML